MEASKFTAHVRMMRDYVAGAKGRSFVAVCHLSGDLQRFLSSVKADGSISVEVTDTLHELLIDVETLVGLVAAGEIHIENPNGQLELVRVTNKAIEEFDRVLVRMATD